MGDKAAIDTIGTTSFPIQALGGYGDGGACFTNDAELAGVMQRISSRPKPSLHHRAGCEWPSRHLQATILLAKLELFDAEVISRQRIGERYANVSKGGCCNYALFGSREYSVYAQYTIEVSNRTAVQDALKAGLFLQQFTTQPCSVATCAAGLWEPLQYFLLHPLCAIGQR